MKIFALILLFSFSMAAFSDGFDSVDGSIGVSPLKGNIHISCYGQMTNHIFYTCYEDIVDPAASSYFSLDSGVMATQISFTAHREDGSTKTKTYDYDKNKLRTKRKVNLIINTLFQRPLLKRGKNLVFYKVYKKKDVLYEAGPIEINVDVKAFKTCPTSYYKTWFSNDCNQPQLYCLRYFNQHNYCQ